MNADDDLVQRAVDGDLSPAEEEALAGRLRQEPELARQLVKHARHEALLGEVVPEAGAVPVAKTRKTPVGGILTMAAVLLISATTFWAIFSGAPAAPSAPLQDENRLRDAWPKLVDAWRAVDQQKPDADALSDERLKLMNKVHAAFEAAGWLDAQPEFTPAALKQLFKLRQGGDAAQQGARFWLAEKLQADGVASHRGSLGTLLESVRKLKELKDKGLDDEDNVQDLMAAIRTSFKQLHLTADDTPVWLRRRLVTLAQALVLGEAYPEPARATDAQAKQIQTWVADLGAAELETRDTAARDLAKAGEVAAPFLREALKSPDKEVGERAKKLLGIGHEPWKVAAAAAGDPASEKAQWLEALRLRELDAARAAEEAEKKKR